MSQLILASVPLEGEIRHQLSMGRRERALALLVTTEAQGSPGAPSADGLAVEDVRIGAFEEALAGGDPALALRGARQLLVEGSALPYAWWMAKSLEGRALLDMGLYDEALQWMEPGLLRGSRSQFWYFDALLTLGWVHLFRGEVHEVRASIVPRLLLCQLPGFGPWFAGQGHYLLGLTSTDLGSRRSHFQSAREQFAKVESQAVFPSSWKAENLYFGAVSGWEASGRTDPAPLARARLTMARSEWASDLFGPLREALNHQLAVARHEDRPPTSGRVARRHWVNLEA